MSLTTPPPENDINEGPVSSMNWGDDAPAGGLFQIVMDADKTIDDFYYRDSQGHLQLQPSYRAQIDRSQIDWWGVALDLAIITFGALGGAGESILTAIGVGGTAGTAASLEQYKKKKNG